MRNNLILTNVLILLLFCALTPLMFFPFTMHINDSFLNVGDTLFNFWTFNWNLHAIFNHPSDLFNSNIFFPEQNTLAYSEHQYLTSLIYGIILLIVQNKILAYNLFYFLTFALSGFCCYLLVNYLTKNKIAGLISGVFFAFFPYKINHIAHIQLLSLFWIPLSVLYLFKIFEENKLKNIFLFSLFTSFMTLSSFYLGFQLLFILFFIWISFIFIYKRNFLKKTAWLLLAVVIILIINLPFLFPYLELSRSNPEFVRTIEALIQFSAEPKSFFTINSVNYVFDLIYSRYLSKIVFSGEGWFNGFLILILAATATISVFFSKKDYKNNTIKITFFLICIFFFVMGLGPYLKHGSTVTNIKLPYYYFFKYLPGFNSLRAPFRFALGFSFALSVLGGYGAIKVLNFIKNNKVKTMIGSIIFLLLFIEMFTFPLWPKGFNGMVNIPQAYQEIANKREDLFIFEPTINNEQTNYYAAYHFKKVPNALSGYFPQGYRKLINEIKFIESISDVRNLISIGINFLVIDENIYGKDDLLRILNKNLKDFNKEELGAKYLVKLKPEDSQRLMLCENPILIYGGYDELNYPYYIFKDKQNSFVIFSQFNKDNSLNDYNHSVFPMLTYSEADGFKAKYIPSIPAANYNPGEEANLDVLVKNSGTEIWGIKENPDIVLSYRIIDSKTNNVINSDNEIYTLKKITFPGDDVNFHVKFKVPEKPGEYYVEFDMKAEGRFWFKEMGSETYLLPLYIGSENFVWVDEESINKLDAALDQSIEIKLKNLEKLEYELNVKKAGEYIFNMGYIGKYDGDCNFYLDGKKYPGDKIYKGERLTLFALDKLNLSKGIHDIKIDAENLYKPVAMKIVNNGYNKLLANANTTGQTCLYLDEAFSAQWTLFVNGKQNNEHFIGNYFRNVWYIKETGNLEIKLIKKSNFFPLFILSNIFILGLIFSPLFHYLIKFKRKDC